MTPYEQFKEVSEKLSRDCQRGQRWAIVGASTTILSLAFWSEVLMALAVVPALAVAYYLIRVAMLSKEHTRLLFAVRVPEEGKESSTDDDKEA